MEILVFCTTFFTSLFLIRRAEARLLRRTLARRMNLKDSAPASNATPDRGSPRHLLSSLGRIALPKKEKDLGTIRKKLIHAGYRDKDAPVLFYGVKVGLGAALALLGLMVMTAWGLAGPRGLVFLSLPFGAGYLVPDLVLKRKIQDRKTRIFRELPDTLDLLMICLRAGLGFDDALYRVCRELAELAPVLSGEFGLYFLEVRSGIPRSQALDNLEARNPSNALKSVVMVLHQSFSTGTDIAGALAVTTDAMRTQRQQAAEEEGAKLSTKLTLPLVAFIMPALILIILGPVIINFIRMVGQGQ